MATSPRERLQKEKNRIKQLTNTDARDRILELAIALDPDTLEYKYTEDGTVREYAVRSIERYVQGLRSTVEAGIDLTTCTSEEFNTGIDRIPDAEGLAKTTLAGYQIAAKKFYRYHSDLGVDPESIQVYSDRSEPRHDEQDMFTEDEVNRLRQSCSSTKNPVRNRAMLELLIFTGQRIRALVTLRLKDIDTQDGYLYLNDTVDGLKGARKRGRKRPLFGARKYVRDLIQYHPTSDPDDWLFKGDPSHWKTDPEDHWAEVSTRHVFRRIREDAEVMKPVNPHNFRHYFTTVMKRDYDLDRDEIRMLLGVSKESTVMDTTYSHVTSGDYIRSVETKLGLREAEASNRFAPPVCPTCGEVLEAEWRRCPACDELFAPKIKEAADRLGLVRESANERALDGLDPESPVELTASEVQALRSIIHTFSDPDAAADELTVARDT